jgi:hypothetical protein
MIEHEMKMNNMKMNKNFYSIFYSNYSCQSDSTMHIVKWWLWCLFFFDYVSWLCVRKINTDGINQIRLTSCHKTNFILKPCTERHIIFNHALTDTCFFVDVVYFFERSAIISLTSHFHHMLFYCWEVANTRKNK